MSSFRRRPKATGNRRASGPAPLVAAALVFALLTGAAIAAGAASGGDAGTGRLRSDLAQMTELAQRRLRPPALQLAQDLPGEGDRLSRLREPASTAQAQTKIALDELRQMNALTIDPHYMPALIAAGRAYTAISGLDPLTGTAVNPEYPGLGSELAAGAAQLDRLGEDAGKLPAGVKRLSGLLARAKRHARLAERQIRDIRARIARARRR